MADVSVEFGAKDTGLEQTLKNVQTELAALNEEQKTAAMSADEFQKSLNKIRQLEGLETKLQQMTGATEEVAEAAKAAAEPARDLSEEFKKISEPLMTLEQRLSATSAELDELREKATTAHMSSEELNATLKKIAELEATERKLEKLSESMTDAGDAASGAAPQIDESADSMDEVGTSATDAGEKSEMGFVQMAAAVAVGQAAVELAMGAIKGAIDGVVGMFDKFGEALDKGAELDILSTRTGVASGELSRLGRALENTGASSDMLGPIFDKMNRALANSGEEGGRAGDALGKLGINIDHLKTLSPDQQFELIGKSLSNVADRSERVDIAMDIFGRGSGSRLLRLFEDYEGTMAQVDRQLGTFPSIMDAMSASFESASTEINAAKEKMVEFATGILSRVMPAIESIAMGLASIDAAALGQKLADAFTGGTAAMKGFQSAIDAIRLGEFGKAFELIFESIKLQLMQTGNEIVNVFRAAFQTASEIISEVFREDGPTFMLIRSAFDYVAGYAKEKIAGAMSEMFASMGPAFANISKSLEQHANAGAKAAELALLRIPSMAELAAEDIATVLGKSPEKFIENLDKSKSSFFDIEEQSKKVAELQAEIAKKAAELPPNLENANDAAGRLGQNSFLFSQNIQSGGNAASNAKSSLDALAGSAGSLKTETGGAADNLQTVGALADEIAQKKMEAGARDLNAEIRQVQAEYGQLMTAMGIPTSPNVSLSGIISDLGLANNGLDSTEIKLEQVKRAVQALDQTPVADITPILDDISASSKIRRIGDHLRENFKGLDVTPYIDREAVGQGVSSTKNTIESALSEFTAVVRLEPQIQQDINDIKNTLATELADPTKVALEGEDDIKQVRESAESNFAQPISLNLEGDETIDAARQFAESTFEETIPMQLNADESISQIREDLKEQIDVAIQSSKGTEHLSSIDRLVEKIENLVSKISEKLPMQALA
jgi:uncharacterized coiled-coil DUF342 family protein